MGSRITDSEATNTIYTRAVCPTFFNSSYSYMFDLFLESGFFHRPTPFCFYFHVFVKPVTPHIELFCKARDTSYLQLFLWTCRCGPQASTSAVSSETLRGWQNECSKSPSPHRTQAPSLLLLLSIMMGARYIGRYQQITQKALQKLFPFRLQND